MNRRGHIGAAVAVVVALAVGWGLCRERTKSTRTAQSSSRVQGSATMGATTVSDARVIRHARPAAPLERLTLRGSVVDREGKAVEGATVVLARPTRTTKSGRDGKFSFDALLPGRYVVEARRGSSIGGPLGVELDARTDVTLRLYGGYVLEVEVFAVDTGRPIPNADVEVVLISMHPGAGRQRAITDATGIAKLEGVTFIGHDLRVSAAGYADDRRGPGPDLGERAPGVRRMRIGLHRATTEVVGKLVDDKGAAVEGEVEVVPYRGGEGTVDEAKLASRFGAVDPHAALRSSLGLRTTPQGTFRLGLEPGTWVVIASAPNRDTAVSDAIFVDAKGPARKELTLVLGSGRVVRGVVVDAKDREVGAAHVEARWLDGTRTITTTTSDNGGGFELRGLPAAPIEVIARTADARSAPVGIDVTSADADGVLVMLGFDGAITGRIVDDRGGPIPDAVVTYLEERPGAAITLYPDVVVTDDTGKFKITGISPTVRYFLSAARPQDGSFGQHASSATAKAGDDVTITIPAGGAIVGRVVGVPNPRTVTVRDRQTNTTVHPTADGKFRLDRLPALRYQLRFSGPGIADTYVEDIDVANGRDTSLGDVTLRAGRKIAGVVIDTRGKLVEEASVRIEVDGRYAVTTRAVGGKFSMTVLSAPVVVTATHPDVGRTAAVSLDATSNATNLRLAMLPGGVIRGIARANGAPIPDAPVTVWPLDARPTEPIAAAFTDDAGAFTLVGVPAGKWFVELSLPAFEREHRVMQQGIEVAVGASVELLFDATKAPEGTIVQPRPTTRDMPVYTEESEDH